ADPSLMRGAFEDLLRRVVPVRAIRLRDSGSRWGGRELDGIESIALEVPGPDPGSQGVLEAMFDPGSYLGDWDLHTLSTAAQLGTVVLEIERCRTQLMRAGFSPGSKRANGAAPLIGTTAVMR